MIKHWLKGLIAVALLSLLFATIAPTPLSAATGYGVGSEQDNGQGDDGQGDDGQGDDGQGDDGQGDDGQGDDGQGDDQNDNDQNDNDQNDNDQNDNDQNDNDQNDNDQNDNGQGNNTQNQGQQGQLQGQQGQQQDPCANLMVFRSQNTSQQGQQQSDMLMVGTSRRTANFPTNCWVSLGPDETHWYQFRYQGLVDEDDGVSTAEEGDDEESTPQTSQSPTVNARLRMDTPGCVDFIVTTPRRLQNPDPDDDGINEPVGAGTPAFIIEEDGDNRDESELNWEGRAEANVNFYVIVSNERDFTCAYNLSLEGSAVPVQGQQRQGQQGQGQQQGQVGQQNQQQGQQQVQQQQQNQQTQQRNQLSSCGIGSNASTAGFPAGCQVSLAPTETHWYAFRYQGDDTAADDDTVDPPNVNARLQMDTPGCVNFQVMTPRRLQNPDPDDDDVAEPVGVGTPAFIIEEDGDNRDESELTWQGTAAANTTFYIIVNNMRDFTCNYSLALSGTAVPGQVAPTP